MAGQRDIDAERRRDLAARRAAVRENRSRGVSANLREALRLVEVGGKLRISATPKQ